MHRTAYACGSSEKWTRLRGKEAGYVMAKTAREEDGMPRKSALVD